MKITIDSAILEKDGFTLTEFSVILYYLSGGKGILNEDLCNSLWNKGFLVKDIEGFIIDNNKLSMIQDWMARSGLTNDDKNSIKDLAIQLRGVYPSGKKAGTSYYWKDSSSLVEQRLTVFFHKFPEAKKYSNEEIVKATDEYVKSFNGSYQYMQLLKYFIFKREGENGIYTSQLLSYLDNKGQVDAQNESWRMSVR